MENVAYFLPFYRMFSCSRLNIVLDFLNNERMWSVDAVWGRYWVARPIYCNWMSWMSKWIFSDHVKAATAMQQYY